MLANKIDKRLAQAINDVVDETITLNQDQLVSGVFENVTFSDLNEDIIKTLITNLISVTTKSALQTTLAVLIECGLLSVDEGELRKASLRVVDSEK